MSTETDPPIIQADVPFSVEAVRGKSGLIDALSKRPRLSTSELEDDTAADTGPADPSRRITDTRARIASDDAPTPEAGALTPDADASATAHGQVPDPIPKPGSEPQLAAPPASMALPDNTSAGPSEAGEWVTEPEAAPLSELERRMLDIKHTNQSVARELEALEESLRQPPASV